MDCPRAVIRVMLWIPIAAMMTSRPPNPRANF